MPRQITQIKKILASDRHFLLVIKFIVLKTILSMDKSELPDADRLGGTELAS